MEIYTIPVSITSDENMKRAPTLKQMMERHELADNERFDKIPTRDDIVKVVGDAVDVKINGKLVGLKQDNVDLKEHLKTQDLDMQWIKYAVKGVLGGLGLIFVGLVINILSGGKL